MVLVRFAVKAKEFQLYAIYAINNIFLKCVALKKAVYDGVCKA